MIVYVLFEKGPDGDECLGVYADKNVAIDFAKNALTKYIPGILDQIVHYDRLSTRNDVWIKQCSEHALMARKSLEKGIYITENSNSVDVSLYRYGYRINEEMVK